MSNPSENRPALFLITGIMAAGKSTIAQRLAERLPCSVHLRGDSFRRMIVSDREEMGSELSPEARKQLSLRYRIAVSVAEQYHAAGFHVVYQDIILGTDLADVVQSLSRFADPLYVVVLCPDTETVASREAGRSKTGYGTLSIAPFDHALRTETPRIGYWLDSSSLTVEQTVDDVLANMPQALVPPLSAPQGHMSVAARPREGGRG